MDPSSPTDDTTPFNNNDEVLEAAVVMFRSRRELADKESLFQQENPVQMKSMGKVVHDLTRNWHARFSKTRRSVLLADVCRRFRLNRLETEVLIALLFGPLGLWENRVSDVDDVLRVLSLPPSRSLAALRALSEAGKLYGKGILFYDDPDDDLRDRKVEVDPVILQSVLQGTEADSALSRLKKEDDLRDTLARLTRAMYKKSDALNDFINGYGQRSQFEKWSRKQDWMMRQLEAVLKARPAWKLSRARKEIAAADDWIILLALMGKALGHINAEDALFTGAGLSRTLCGKPEDFRDNLKRLMPDAPLVREECVQPCGGEGGLLSDNDESIQQTEFELTEKALDLLGLEKAGRISVKRDADLRLPQISLNDLALPDCARRAVGMALDHVRNAGRLMTTWGLRNAFPYGTGVTMLFYGPPGTGKTATAEAVAHELGKPLFVADYSKIQNCYVGNTEKNIVKTFRKARQHHAVLFWDEADAMFFDRDSAARNWEVRDVNVLLQEMERFEGVCILATNRKTTLDKALERRITAKVEFPRPDRELREAIWHKLIPKSLPLAPDVDFASLSRADVAGGEIKNVILNASRFACGRGDEAIVTAEDFERALAMETNERWSGQSGKRPIGFNLE